MLPAASERNIVDLRELLDRSAGVLTRSILHEGLMGARGGIVSPDVV